MTATPPAAYCLVGVDVVSQSRPRFSLDGQTLKIRLELVRELEPVVCIVADVGDWKLKSSKIVH